MILGAGPISPVSRNFHFDELVFLKLDVAEKIHLVLSEAVVVPGMRGWVRLVPASVLPLDGLAVPANPLS
jgi:hypothetical protein